jgi:hypothetical protein
LFAQSLHFGFDQIVGAAIDHARHREVHGIDERRGADGEDNGIDDRDTERRGIENTEKSLIGTHLGTWPQGSLKGRYSSSRKL